MLQEHAQLWSVPHLDGLTLLRADFVTYGFKRHMHDYFVIGMIEAGLQKFSYQRDVFVTPPTGLIIINPGRRIQARRQGSLDFAIARYTLSLR